MRCSTRNQQQLSPRRSGDVGPHNPRPEQTGPSRRTPTDTLQVEERPRYLDAVAPAAAAHQLLTRGDAGPTLPWAAKVNGNEGAALRRSW